MATLLAHQGGWDELLMFLLPIVLVVATWYVMERRRARRRPEPTEGTTPAGPDLTEPEAPDSPPS